MILKVAGHEGGLGKGIARFKGRSRATKQDGARWRRDSDNGREGPTQQSRAEQSKYKKIQANKDEVGITYLSYREKDRMPEANSGSTANLPLNSR